MSALALGACSPVALAGQFVYEGRLDDTGQAANGRYDLRLSAFGHAELGAPVAAPITFTDVPVKDGRFRLEFDLPGIGADDIWLAVDVKAAGTPAFSTIAERSKAIAAPLIGACWSTSGDAGSNPATDFLGTTDSQPLVLRVNQQQALRLEPNETSPNLIAGSRFNVVTTGASGATIGGGGDSFSINRVTDDFGSVVGGRNNQAGNGNADPGDSSLANVAGGLSNTASSFASFVGGGSTNTASGATSSVAGGTGNTASAARSTVGGGSGNTASGSNTTVGGGSGNSAMGQNATVGGGQANGAGGNWSTVGGGRDNAASGNLSTVSGGLENCAGGLYSWAGGRQAKARPGSDPVSGSCSGLGTYPGGSGDQGSFIWADSQAADFVSSGANQFLVRAQGGIYLGTNSSVSIPADRFINTSTGAHLTAGGTWTNASSRWLKSDFAAVNSADVLDRVLRLSISTWGYRGSSEGRHMGPVAEDFHAMFALGWDNRSISTVDADGVALAAIQGLNRKLEAERDALKSESSELRARLAKLEALIAARVGTER